MAGNPSWIGSAESVNLTTNSVSRYSSFGNGGIVTSSSTETTYQAPSIAGTYSKLGVHVTANTRITDVTIRFRKNTANGNQIVTIPAGTTGFFRDNVNSDAAADGDLVNYSITTSTGGGSITFNVVDLVFTPTAANTSASLFHNDQANAGSSLGNRAFSFAGTNTVSSAYPDPSAALYAPDAGFMSKLHVTVTANTSAVTTSTTMSLAGTSGTLTINVGAGATGLFQDTTHSDAVAEGGPFYALMVSRDTTARPGCWWTGSSTLFALSSHHNQGRTAPPSGVTTYYSPFGRLIGNDSTTEATVQARAPIAQTIKKMRLYYALNNNTSAVTFMLRVNGADTGLFITVPGSGTKTGYFEAAADVTVLADDLICIRGSGANNTSSLVHLSLVGDSDVAVHTDNFTRISQADMYALAEVERSPRISQAAIYALAELERAARIGQAAIYTAVSVIPAPRLTQVAVYVLADVSPCETRRATCWKITRRDGRVLTFTSHDQDMPWGGRVYKACNSLDPSASENSSALGSVSNTEMSGIISHDDITEADLYGGLFDDAFVEVWLVPWDTSSTDTPKRLQAGWMGNISQGEVYFKAEVLGAGQRIGQQTLTEPITPLCRVHLGSAECGVDIEALKVEGHVLATFRRDLLSAEVAEGSAPAQWENGFVRFTSGVNDGYEVEVRSVDFDTGEIVLMIGSPYLSSYGDTFDLYPGCNKILSGGCTLYDNVLNHRGFDNIPGVDSMLETPDSKI